LTFRERPKGPDHQNNRTPQAPLTKVEIALHERVVAHLPYRCRRIEDEPITSWSVGVRTGDATPLERFDQALAD